MHPKQADTSIYTITWHTHALWEQHVHIVLENDPKEAFSLIKSETDFDLTGAKFLLRVNAHTGMNRKTCFYFGEEKQLLDFQAVCLLSWNSWFGESTHVHKAASFCTMREFVLAREREKETNPQLSPAQGNITTWIWAEILQWSKLPEFSWLQ